MRRFREQSVIDFTKSREALARVVKSNADEFENFVVPPPPMKYQPPTRSYFARRPDEGRPRRRA